MTTPADDEIIALEDELRRAMLAGDVDVLGRLIDDDLAFVTYTGGIADKAMDLAAHAARTLQLITMSPSDMRIRRYDESIAVVTVRMAATGTYSGIPFDSEFRYLRVWRRRGDGWRIVAGSMVTVVE